MCPLRFQLVRSERRYARMFCLFCSKELTGKHQKKYCSTSCAASANNRRADVRRRQLEGSCNICGKAIQSSRKRCQDCRYLSHREAVLTHDPHRRSNISICTRARKLYFADRPYVCVICGYNKQVQVCHVVDIKSYPDGTPYVVINHPANLIGLCPNHHWEFDHDLL